MVREVYCSKVMCPEIIQHSPRFLLSPDCRFEAQLTDEEQAMQQRTRRLYSDLQEEKEKFAKEQHQLTQQFQEKEKMQKVGMVKFLVVDDIQYPQNTILLISSLCTS